MYEAQWELSIELVSREHDDIYMKSVSLQSGVLWSEILFEYDSSVLQLHSLPLPLRLRKKKAERCASLGERSPPGAARSLQYHSALHSRGILQIGFTNFTINPSAHSFPVDCIQRIEVLLGEYLERDPSDRYKLTIIHSEVSTLFP